jgi:hypothetical protein
MKRIDMPGLIDLEWISEHVSEQFGIIDGQPPAEMFHELGWDPLYSLVPIPKIPGLDPIGNICIIPAPADVSWDLGSETPVWLAVWSTSVGEWPTTIRKMRTPDLWFDAVYPKGRAMELEHEVFLASVPPGVSYTVRQKLAPYEGLILHLLPWSDNLAKIIAHQETMASNAKPSRFEPWR